MVSYDLALTAITAASGAYSMAMGVAPDAYLEMDDTEKNSDTRGLCRAVASGLVGYTAGCYIARRSTSGDAKRALLCSTATCGAAFTANNIARVVKKKDAVAPKIDLVTAAAVTGISAAALFMNKGSHGGGPSSAPNK